ncbi:hypothetical protein FOZ63_016139 [Perkinsus olseni]|uniref:Uncharacterized protein n=1 Tax=Perkinsus olseni TaxID=32597 RepID=A0A7J6RXD5_PEROL|nr:hypothetical protein FOZ63_016139 [Perkinsus olseni]
MNYSGNTLEGILKLLLSSYSSHHIHLHIRYCNIPLSAREFNKHIDDGTRYGRCPMAPQPDLILEAVKAAARERAKRVIVGNVRGKGRKCSICGLPITADLREMGSDIYMVSHERFYDKDKHSVWYCPVGENIGTGELEELRTLKENRRQEQQRKKNEYKRKRYREEQENA